MNTKLATRFTTLAIAATAVLGFTGTHAGAATLTCNAANKGRIVKTKVCSYEKGRYAWVTVVPQTKSPASAAPTTTLPGTKFTSADNYMTATILPNWKTSTEEQNFVIAYSIDIWTPAGFSGTAPAITFNSLDYGYGQGADAEKEMNKQADEYSTGIRSVVARDVQTVNGRTVARFVWIQNNDPDTRNMDVYVASKDKKRLIIASGTYIRTNKSADRYKAEINQMIAALVIR
jgi:hypothetical protein